MHLVSEPRHTRYTVSVAPPHLAAKASPSFSSSIVLSSNMSTHKYPPSSAIHSHPTSPPPCSSSLPPSPTEALIASDSLFCDVYDLHRLESSSRRAPPRCEDGMASANKDVSLVSAGNRHRGVESVSLRVERFRKEKEQRSESRSEG